MKKITFVCIWIAITSISISQLIITKRLNEQSNTLYQHMQNEVKYLKEKNEILEKINKLLESYQRGNKMNAN